MGQAIADAIVGASDVLRPAAPILVTLIGAWIAWIAIHRVARMNAKRDAYARYVGAAEIYANDWRRIGAAKHAGRASVLIDPAQAQPVNEPLGAILLVAPVKIAARVHQSQEALARLTAAANGAGDWEDAVASWQSTRDDLINAMRRDTGADPLPKEFFTER